MKKIIALVAIFALLVISGCTQQAAETPSPALTSAPAGAEPGIVTQSGSAQAFGEGILKCTSGTPWEFTAGTSSSSDYKASYSIEGKTQFKGSEYCKVKGKIESTGGMAGFEELSYDYYFKVDQTGTTYSDVWFVMSLPGHPTQEVHVVTGAGGQQ